MSRGTIHRTIRIDDALWTAAKAKADAEGVNLSEVIREALRAYIEDEPHDHTTK
jgi:predicted DNA binding CopG/RHH family protein